MELELENKLDAAGFPFKTEFNLQRKPTLEDLLTALGEEFAELVKRPRYNDWIAWGSQDKPYNGTGPDAITALTNLWLSLHTKSK